MDTAEAALPLTLDSLPTQENTTDIELAHHPRHRYNNPHHSQAQALELTHHA